MKIILLPFWFTVFWFSLLFLGTPGFLAEAQSPPEPKGEGQIGEWWKKLESGIVDPIKGTRYSWKEGLWIEGPEGNFKLKIGGKFMADAGKINADDTLKNALPGIEDEKGGVIFRYLAPYVQGTLSDFLEFKFEMDFANIRDIRDIWVSFKNIPYLGQIKVGYFGQPMSLEDQNSSRDITFMERALPVLAFPPGLDIGVMAINTAFRERMTWAAGVFRIMGSFSNVGEARNQWTEQLGTSLAARVTYLPIYGQAFDYYSKRRTKIHQKGNKHLRGGQMKRSMEKLAVFVMIATIAIFIGAATTSANDDDWKALHGEYTMVAEGTCLFSLKGFNSNFTPIDPTHYPPWTGSSQGTGIWTFEGNGKGTVQGTEFTLTLSPNPHPSAASAEFSFDFAYKVKDDGTVTVDMLIETFQGKYLTGPSAGLTYKYETSPPIFRLFGMVSADHKTITLASGNDVQKISLSNRITVFAICNLGRTLIRLAEVGGNPKKR